MLKLDKYVTRANAEDKAEDWMYSSQRNYSGLENLLEIDEADI